MCFSWRKKSFILNFWLFYDVIHAVLHCLFFIFEKPPRPKRFLSLIGGNHNWYVKFKKKKPRTELFEQVSPEVDMIYHKIEKKTLNIICYLLQRLGFWWLMFLIFNLRDKMGDFLLRKIPLCNLTQLRREFTIHKYTAKIQIYW